MAKHYLFRSYVLILLVGLAIAGARDAVRVRLTSIKCTIRDHTTVENVTCSLSDDPVPSISGRGSLKRELNEARLHYKLAYFIKDLEEEISSGVHNVCENFDDSSVNFILSVIVDDLMRFSVMPNKCPLPAKTEYSVRNFSIDNRLMPSMLNQRTGYFKVELYTGNTLLGDVVIEGVTEKYKI